VKTLEAPQDLLVLGFAESREQAEALAEALHCRSAMVAVHHFPDGESKVCLPPELAPRVVMLRSLDRPNDKLVELMIAADAARQLGAEHITLVAPYLCYMRQDMAFEPGEAVSQRIVGKRLAQWFDALVTVDPHLHRIATLQEAVPLGEAARALTAAPLLGALAVDELDNPILLGPDEEAAQWVSVVAGDHGAEWAVCKKLRHGDRHVDIALPDLDFHGRNVVLIDDVASSGETLARCAEQVRDAGAARICAMVTHALFADDALLRVVDAGVSLVWSTDSIPHPSNAVPLVHLLAAGVTHALEASD
jgi:ribose-phosphate pyrophosphokinase